ncbi:chromate ion transporter-like protein [Ascodesmis nigricans]|uniref:Chromate ion transporter-like protein n=1 Tax=Ascodesmis nigricans TaxID=341454 RepID=A0A4S2MSK6_9PEZI|nr:chromate ion transporter-like protein [Ascodesmis nigricans]
MPLKSLISAAAQRTTFTSSSSSARRPATGPEQPSKLFDRLLDVFVRTYDLGFTAFGGPPVHFQILHKRFVDGNGKAPWIDEQIYQELFAICQALPGPASTKMAFCIALYHAGFVPALFVFVMWALPGAIGMFALAIGVGKMNEVLPAWAYALLSGLNAATVGIIALAAVQLARKAITDPLTRILVAAGGCAGLCYNALWYFPTLMAIAGLVTVAWDCYLRGKIGRWRQSYLNKREAKRRNEQRLEEENIEMSPQANSPSPGLTASSPSPTSSSDLESRTVPPQIDNVAHKIPIKIGISVIILFFVSFTIFMILRGTLQSPPLAFSLFANMYLAGTIIFGGGPVVIPLLRSYVVDPGWVTPRNFLLGLALIQAFPGPNFNFAVYLGALTLAPLSLTGSQVLGAVIAFVGIFFPGITLAIGFQSVWRALRSRPWVASMLRGVNAAAVGLVFTAVYRLWEIGYLTVEENRGQSLAKEPWWVVVAATTYTVVEWFGVPPAVAIVGGGVMGLCWFGAVKA